MSLLCHCPLPQPRPACSSGNSLCTGSFLRLDTFPSSWLAPLTIIGWWIKLHLFRDAHPDYPSEVDSSCYSYHPSCCLLQLTCNNADCLFTLLLRGPQTVISIRAFHVYWCVHSALHNAWPVGVIDPYKWGNEWMKGWMKRPHLKTKDIFFWLSFCLFFKHFKIYLFLTEGWLLYNILLVSAIHKYESAIGIHMSPPSWMSLPPSTPPHPSRLSQSPGWSCLSHTTNSPWLSILRMVMCMFACYSLGSPHLLFPPIVPTSLFCVCVSTAALQIGSSALSF